MKVTMISRTEAVDAYPWLGNVKDPEALMAYCARVSSPHQEKEDYESLLNYCIKNEHWSVFEMADMTIEIETSRAIAQQILRHRSFVFQEFSQRYAVSDSYEMCEARRQDTKNRQNSLDDLPSTIKENFIEAQRQTWIAAQIKYQAFIRMGVAKECARFLLPLNTTTRLYMKGSVRSWIHYIKLRTMTGTQKEHRDIALAIRDIFCREFPCTAKACGWIEK